MKSREETIGKTHWRYSSYQGKEDIKEKVSAASLKSQVLSGALRSYMYISQ